MEQRFADLLKNAQEVAKVSDGFIEPLQGPLSQLFARTEKFAEQRKGKVLPADQARAFQFVNPQYDMLHRQLQSADLRTAYEPEPTPGPTDVAAYLQSKHEEVCAVAIEEVRAATLARFEECFARSMDRDFERAKSELRRAMEFKRPDLAASSRPGAAAATPALSKEHSANLSFGRVSATPMHPGGLFASPSSASPISRTADFAASSALGTPGRQRPDATPATGLDSSAYRPGRGASKLSLPMKSYAGVVHRLCTMVHRKAHVNALQEFINCADSIDDDPARKAAVKDLFVMAQCVVREGVVEPAGLNRQSMVEGARVFLELQFLSFVQNFTRRQGRLSGNPSPAELIGSFISAKGASSAKSERIGDLPLYEYIFYCLRCTTNPGPGQEDGFLKAACDRANEFKQSLDCLPELLQEFLTSKRRPSASNIDLARREYTRLKNSKGLEDPFKRAVYVILAKEGKDDCRDVCNVIEHWQWLKLSVCAESIASDAAPAAAGSGQYYTLAELQTAITGIGAARLNQSSSVTYFQALMLSLQFREAIDNLMTVPGYKVEAVHLAIALQYYLQPTPVKGSVAAINRSGDPKEKQIPLAVIIREYVSAFSDTDLREAVSYLCLLTPQEREESLTELAMKHRDTSSLLGTVRAGGEFKPGCVSELLPTEEVVRIVASAAQRTQVEGRYRASVELFRLLERLDTSGRTSYLLSMLGILNLLLSKVVAAPASSLSSSITPSSFASSRLPYSRSGEEALGDSMALPMEGLGEESRSSIVQYARDLQKQIQGAGGKSRTTQERAALLTFDRLLQLSVFFDNVAEQRYREALEVLEAVELLPSRSERVQAYSTELDRCDATLRDNVPDVLHAAMRCLAALAVLEPMEIDKWRHSADALRIFAGMRQASFSASLFADVGRLAQTIR